MPNWLNTRTSSDGCPIEGYGTAHRHTHEKQKMIMAQVKILDVYAIATIALFVAAGPAFADAAAPQLPEPGTLALLVGGVATALIVRRRKK